MCDVDSDSDTERSSLTHFVARLGSRSLCRVRSSWNEDRTRRRCRHHRTHHRAGAGGGSRRVHHALVSERGARGSVGTDRGRRASHVVDRAGYGGGADVHGPPAVDRGTSDVGRGGDGSSRLRARHRPVTRSRRGGRLRPLVRARRPAHRGVHADPGPRAARSRRRARRRGVPGARRQLSGTTLPGAGAARRARAAHVAGRGRSRRRHRHVDGQPDSTGRAHRAAHPCRGGRGWAPGAAHRRGSAGGRARRCGRSAATMRRASTGSTASYRITRASCASAGSSVPWMPASWATRTRWPRNCERSPAQARPTCGPRSSRWAWTARRRARWTRALLQVLADED